jgi:hypothetical protein
MELSGPRAAPPIRRGDRTGVLTGCTPRRAVLARERDDAIFAADAGDLIDGVAPEV